MTEYVTLALAETCTGRSPVIEYMTPGPAVNNTAPALEIEYAAPAPVVQHVALTPVVTCAVPAPVFELTFAPDDTNIAPESPRINHDIRGLENPQFSTFALGASASQVVGSFLAVDESVRPFTSKCIRNRSLWSQGVFERTQLCAVENSIHVPTP